MELTRRNVLVYCLLVSVWILAVGWQVEEHWRFKNTAKADLRNRSKDIANTLSAFIRGLRFRDTIVVVPERLDPVLNELVNGRTNELVKSSELLSIALLNAAGEPIAQAGRPLDLEQKDLIQSGERWGLHSVTLVNPVDLGTSLSSQGVTNPTIVLPPRGEFTNAARDAGRQFGRREPRPGEAGPPPPSTNGGTEFGGPPHPGPPPDGHPPELDEHHRDGPPRPRLPFFLRNMPEQEFRSLIEKRALHGLVMTMSTESFQVACTRDLWLRMLIGALASVLVAGSGMVWRNLAKVSDLQIRLVRASELNTHLREMNLAAAGLAHETRNPLNIIRGLAQLISKQPEATPEVRNKSREILDETDKVASQLNEFINYSRPREVRPAVLGLQAVITEIVRALNYDLEEKKILLQIKGETFNVEADEQLLRQALFNLLLNAVQAVGEGGEIQVVAQKRSATEAQLEVRDNGPGVPPESRAEIFKPYFTTQKTGTGLGLAVVQQIVLAHGWEIQCLANEPKGAVFRITHLKVVG